jgi:hypothetical protein
MKNDISDMIEDKVGNCMNTIAEGLKADLNGLRNEIRALESMVNEGKAEVEGRLKGHQRGDRYSGTTDRALPGGHQGHTERSRCRISGGGRSRGRAGGSDPEAKSTIVKPKFDGVTSWAVFRQYEAAAVQIIGRRVREPLIL